MLTWAFGLAVFGIATFYLLQWLQMPLYQDEVALRISGARFLVDGATDYGLFGQCKSNVRTIALVFQPVAWLYSAFDAAFGWAWVREVPVAGVLLAFGVVLAQVLANRMFALSLLLLAGLIGVAGSGLVMSRMEAPTLFLGSVCFIGYALIRRPTVPPVALGAYLAILTLVTLFALFIHPQSMVFVPIVVLLTSTVLARVRLHWNRVLACLSLICILIGAYAAWDNVAIRCPEMPSVASQFDLLTMPGLAQQQGSTGVQANLQGKLSRYTDDFLFQKTYDVGYLPSIEPRSDREAAFLTFLNGAIATVVLLNLLLACGVACVSAGLVVSIFCRSGPGWRERISAAATAPAMYLFLFASSHLALFVYDTPTNFYRAFYIHLVLVATNVLALSSKSGWFDKIMYPVGLGVAVLCVLSALVTRHEIRPQFIAGWVGPSIALQTDWRAVAADVDRLTRLCKIGPNDPRIVIDDVTYDAMKGHPHLLPLTWSAIGQRNGKKNRTESIQFFKDLSATSIVVRCKSLDQFDLGNGPQINGLCCLKF